jgi:hypothetical protein
MLLMEYIDGFEVILFGEGGHSLVLEEIKI